MSDGSHVVYWVVKWPGESFLFIMQEAAVRFYDGCDGPCYIYRQDEDDVDAADEVIRRKGFIPVSAVPRCHRESYRRCREDGAD